MFCILYFVLCLLPSTSHAAPLRVLALAYAVSGTPQIRYKARQWAKPDPMLGQRLAQSGVALETTIFNPALTAAYLKRFQVVLLLGFPDERRAGPHAAMLRRQLAALQRFVSDGGGLLYLHAPRWSLGRQTASINRWLVHHGARVLRQQVMEQRASRQHRAAGLRTVLGWTANFGRGRLTRGLGGLLYPMGHSAWHNFTQPLQVDRRWTVVLRGGSTARSVKTHNSGDTARLRISPGSHAKAPPLLALRSVGRGRLALWPVASSCLWQDAFHQRWGSGLLMQGSAGALRSDGQALLLRVLYWLGRSRLPDKSGPGSRAGSGPATQPGVSPPVTKRVRGLDWDRIRPAGRFLPRHYVGLIGAQSDLSVGQDSPQKMIHAARQAGYQFIAFTEDLARMTAAKTRRLGQLCKAASSDDFQAVPGFYYLDQAGNAQVVFGPQVQWPRASWFSQRHRGRVTYNNVLFRGFNVMPLAVVRSTQNPKEPWFLGNYKGFAVYTYVHGKLVDDSLAHYRTLAAQGFNLFPMVLHLARSVAGVRAARGRGLMQSYVRWHRGKDPLSAMTGGSGAVYQGRSLHYFPSFISQGPIIEDFRTHNLGTADLTWSGGDRHRTHLLVSSDRELAQLRLRLDAARSYRFAGRGRRMELTVDGFHDRQQHPLLEVQDRAGRRAISWSPSTSVHAYHLVRGADNFNTYSGGKWAHSSRRPLRGIEDYLRPTQVALLPLVLVSRGADRSRALPELMRPAVRQQVLAAGRFGSVVEYRVRHHYPPGASANWNSAVVQSLQQNSGARYVTRVTRFRPRPDGLVVDLVETTLTAHRELLLARQPHSAIVLARTHDARGLLQLEQGGGGTRPRHQTLQLASKSSGSSSARGRLKAGAYVAAYPAPGGSVAFVALQPGLGYAAGRGRSGTTLSLLGGPAQQRWSPGQALSFRYLMVNSGLTGARRGGTVFIRSLIRDMGLGPGGRTAYRVVARRGKVTSRRLVLQLQAAGGAFWGTITSAHLPLDLPVRVSRLNPRWDALLWYRGAARLRSLRWQLDRHGRRHVVRPLQERRDALIRFPVVRGRGMLQLDTELPRDLFLGHPVQAADSRLRILLTDARAGRETVWLHNSEHHPITTEVWRDRDFTLIPAFRRRLTVPAGASVCIKPRGLPPKTGGPQKSH